ncbi:tripartite tricarboxylate transporter TctB family protein [Devosia sp. A449]
MDITRNPRDLAAGLVFLMIGVGAIVVGQEYNFGSVRQMGAGFFPVVLGYLLSAIGLGCCFTALRTKGQPITGVELRPVILLSLSVIVFGASIRSLGLVPAVSLSVILASLASEEFHIVRALVLAAGLSVFCVLTFIYGLGMSLTPFTFRF